MMTVWIGCIILKKISLEEEAEKVKRIKVIRKPSIVVLFCETLLRGPAVGKQNAVVRFERVYAFTTACHPVTG